MECFLFAEGHVLFDPTSQHAAPAEGFDVHDAAQEADTPGASSSGMDDTTGFLGPPVYNRFPMGKAPVPKPSGAAATAQNVAKGDGPDRKRRRTDPSGNNLGVSHPAVAVVAMAGPPVAAKARASVAIADPDTTPGGPQVATLLDEERYAVGAPSGIAPPALPPTTSGLQIVDLEWFVSAPPALQGIASSLLASYATVVRARASGPSRGAPSAGTPMTPGAAGSSSGVIMREPTVAPAERVGHLRASPERAFRSRAA